MSTTYCLMRVILKSAISAYSAIDRYQAPFPALNIKVYHHHHFIRQNYTYIKHVKEYSWQDTPGSKSAYSSLK